MQPTLTVEDAIRSRLSCRRFTDQPVSLEQIRHILDIARFAPSGSNVQPWQVHVVSGQARDTIVEAVMDDVAKNGEREDREYQYYPLEWFEPYLGRRRKCGWGLYNSVGVTRENKAGMTAQRLRNYGFFDAPVGLFITVSRRLEKGSWMDVGMFIQSILVAARGVGLHTCAQAAFANYHTIIRQHIDIDDEQIVVCAIAVGFGDMDAPENSWRTEREEVDGFTSWHS